MLHRIRLAMQSPSALARPIGARIAEAQAVISKARRNVAARAHGKDFSQFWGLARLCKFHAHRDCHSRFSCATTRTRQSP
jgi:hypothetical protein